MIEVMQRFEASFDAWLSNFAGDEPTLAMARYHFGVGDAAPRRGKRLRPRLLFAVVEHERPGDEQALNDACAAACALELLHNYSLVHDDIEDRDELRHGRPTVWARYGVAHGINTGDLLCSLSYLSLVQDQRIASPEMAARLTRILLEANYAMCLGQGQDIAFESRELVSYDEYLAMIAGKTAALFAAACEMGAIIAGVAPALQCAYGEYGRSYGQAFQMRDDLLGTWGTVETTGKPSGADIKRRKWCFPVVWSLAQPPSAARTIVAEAYAEKAPLSDARVAEVIAAFDALGAREAVDLAVAQAFQRARHIAEVHAIDRDQTLHQLFEVSAYRLA